VGIIKSMSYKLSGICSAKIINIIHFFS